MKPEFIWSQAKDLDSFEEDWSMKQVTVKGIFDHTKEVFVDKYHNGEKGQEVITPFYTHLNQQGEPCGILVNRGFLPQDFKDMKMHYTSAVSGTITGILYRGDAKTKYTYPNAITNLQYTNVEPTEIALVTQMKNLDEASQFMLLQIDANDNARQLLPTLPTREDLTVWRKISPDRHEAYANLWKYLTFGGIFANTAMWLYF